MIHSFITIIRTQNQSNTRNWLLEHIGPVPDGNWSYSTLSCKEVHHYRPMLKNLARNLLSEHDPDDIAQRNVATSGYFRREIWESIVKTHAPKWIKKLFIDGH